MKSMFVRGALAVLLVVGVTGLASAQVTVTLPDTGNQSTTLTANVSEQAQVTVPATITFNVIDVASPTSANASVTISNIVLSTAAKQLKISIKASAASFTPPVALATTWAASDVSWTASSWTNAAGHAASLDNSAYTELATCTADVTSCSNATVPFTLAANSGVKRAGNHTLTMTWKFESI